MKDKIFCNVMDHVKDQVIAQTKNRAWCALTVYDRGNRAYRFDRRRTDYVKNQVYDQIMGQVDDQVYLEIKNEK